MFVLRNNDYSLLFMVAKHFHSSLGNKTKRRLKGAKSHNFFSSHQHFDKRNLSSAFALFLAVDKFTEVNAVIGRYWFFWGWAVRMILANRAIDSSIFIPWLLSPLKRALFLKVLVCFRPEIGLVARGTRKSEKLSLSRTSVGNDFSSSCVLKTFSFYQAWIIDAATR